MEVSFRQESRRPRLSAACSKRASTSAPAADEPPATPRGAVLLSGARR
jgi:hypothetical protein